MVVVTDEMIETYQCDGVVLVKGLWADWVAELQAGVARNMSDPGPFAAENLRPGDSGRFFDDYCNWDRIPEFERVIKQSEVAEVAAKLMGSDRVQMFHDHVLVKEPGRLGRRRGIRMGRITLWRGSRMCRSGRRWLR